MFKLFIIEIKQWISFIIIYYPETQLGRWLRRKYWEYILKDRIGKQAIFERGSSIGIKNMINVGDNFMIGESASIAAGDSYPIWIGNHVWVSRGAWVRTANHRFDDLNLPFIEQGHDFKTIIFNNKLYSIVIEDHVWIAPNAILLSGAHIGTGSVIGAGSVVSGPIPPYSIVVGNPGRVVKSRLQKKEL